MMYWSKSTKGFYNEATHGVRGEPGCLIPEDAVQVSDAECTTLLEGKAAGKEIFGDADGVPYLADRVPSDDDLAFAARLQRDQLLVTADTMVNSLEDGGSDTTAWRTYRKELRDVPQQAGFPRTITWPVAPQ